MPPFGRGKLRLKGSGPHDHEGLSWDVNSGLSQMNAHVLPPYLCLFSQQVHCCVLTLSPLAPVSTLQFRQQLLTPDSFMPPTTPLCRISNEGAESPTTRLPMTILVSSPGH